MPDLSDRELLDALGVSVEPEKKAGRTPREERIIAGFEDIQRFVEERGHPPAHGEDKDIFERLYAVRLDRLRELSECRDLLAPLDRQGLLTVHRGMSEPEPEEWDDSALLAALGAESDEAADITELKHVRSRAEIRAAEEIANRTVCEDFEKFKPLFEAVKSDLDRGIRQTRPFEMKAEIETGRFFIAGGQIAYVAEKGEEFMQEYGDRDARLRVIYDNGTESNVLMRSLQKALNKDDAGRRITDPSAGPLFAGEAEDADRESGTIYVLRSKSEHPTVAASRDVIHKIGVTGGKVETRIANAKLDPTFLLAEVEVVATYELYNISRSKLENLVHRFFSPARLELEIQDRFGHPVKPREWFLVPLAAIDEAIGKIQDGTIAEFHYDPSSASLQRN